VNRLLDDQASFFKVSQGILPALATSYLVFGLHLRSNRPLPGVVTPIAPANSPQVELHLGIRPYPESEVSSAKEELIYGSSSPSEDGDPGLRLWRVAKGGFLRVAYPDGTQFWVDDKRETVWTTWPATSSLEETSTYLLGPILGLLLRLRGMTCLHASAVSFEGRSVAFLGSPGAGKSTTAAAFARDGHAVLSDDIVALVEREGTFQVLPAYPHLCLWPDSVNMLYGSPDALPRFSTNWEKRRLALGEGGTRFASRALPLCAIYLLGDRRSDFAPCVEAVRAQAALLSLVAETYANKILDREMRAREFEVLSRLVTAVPVRRVCPHKDATRLGELCKVIREDLDSLQLPRSACP
jgi:hypothetical protein